MEVLVIAAIIGLIPAAIASGKGRSFFLWWIYGAAIFIVAIIHAIVLQPDMRVAEAKQLSSGMKKCVHCAELIKQEAKVCKHCGRDA